MKDGLVGSEMCIRDRSSSSLLCHRPHCCVIVLIAVSSSSLLCHRPYCCVIVLILRPLRFLLCQPLTAPSLSSFLEEGCKPNVIQRPSSRRISRPVLLPPCPVSENPFCQEDSVVCTSQGRPSAIKLQTFCADFSACRYVGRPTFLSVSYTHLTLPTNIAV